jgi:hypothetical protein
MLIAGLAFASGLDVRATTLDWDNFLWTPGALSMTYYATNDAFANTAATPGLFYGDSNNIGSSVTVSILGDTTRFIGNGPTPGSYSNVFAPIITNNVFMGGSGGQSTLTLIMNFATNRENISVAVKFNYSQGVSNVTYTLYDVDASVINSPRGFIDQISNIYGTNSSGLVAPVAVFGSISNSVSGTGTNRVVIGLSPSDDPTNKGNVVVAFGTSTLNGLNFTYGNTTNAKGDPDPQGISLYNITFSAKPKVPEVNPALAAGALCCLGVLGQRVRDRRRRNSAAKPCEES